MAAPVSFKQCGFNQTNFSQDPFVESFFSLSMKCEQELSDPEIVSLLKELSSLGYTLSKKKIVFGNEFGKYWPCLEKSGTFCVVGSAVGSRGSFGVGRESLKKYLQSRKQMAATDQTQQKILPEQRTPSNSSSSLSEPPAKKQNVGPSESKPLDLSGFMSVFGGGFSVSGIPFDLKALQSHGFLLELPKEELNSFTVDDLLGASLSVYQGGYYLLQKNKEILAHTPGLVIKTPTSEDSRGKMYDKLMNGKWVSTDDPCDLPRAIETELEDRSALEEMLPFLRGLVPYKKG